MRKLSEDERYMRQAITLAKKAAANGDVPIGCVIVYEGKAVSYTHLTLPTNSRV